ncbi:MAG: 2-oxo acid dehydrogenase subunit E2 [Pirellulaceae bacterium]
MAIEVTLPDLGDGIESGDVLSVHVSEGDTVTKDQPLLELETDKASVDIPSTAAGKVTKIHVSAGDSVAIGSVLVTLEATEAEAKSAEPPKQDPKEEDKPEPTDEPPAKSEEESAEPTEEEPVADEKPAAAPSKPAPAKSASSKPAKADEPVQVKSPTPPAVPAGELIHEDADSVPAGPAVRRFAREVGVDLRMVRGSGPGGRVTRDDVLLTVRQLSQGSGSVASTLAAPTAEATPAATNSTNAPPPIVPTGEAGQDKYGPIKAEKMRRIRKVTAAQMTASWTTVPRVTNFDDADVTALEELRQQSKADYAEAGVKLTTMPFLIKAVALALKAHPEVNATVDLENEQIIYKEYVNVGIAVDSERGLVVPNIRNTDRMSIPDIARTLQQTAADIRGNNFSPSQLQGGTFTISNLGAIGGTYSTPIINIPEVAILLVGRSRMMPVVVDGQIVPRLMMPMSLSYDHRLVDGASAARFLNEVISYLEAPSRLLMAP